MKKTLRKTRKLFAAFLCLVMLASAVPFSAAAETFSDISNDAWYKNDVYALVNKGIISGVGGGKFAPDNKLSRAACAVILTKIVLSDSEVNQYKGYSSFGDVGSNEWYTPYVNWAYEAGVINGYQNNVFRPDRLITRQELAVMISNFSTNMAYPIPGGSSTSYKDAYKIDSWAKNAVSKCSQAGIISGLPDGSFAPQNSTKRCEAAAMFNRFLSKTTKQNYTIYRKRVNGSSVRAVEFSMNDYSSFVAMAQDGISRSETMNNMVSRTGAKFAINAAYFDMSNYTPESTIVQNGNIVITDKGGAPTKPSFIVENSGKAAIKDVKLNQSITLTKENGDSETIQYASKNRTPSTGSDATRIIYDRKWGSSVGIYVKDAIAVENGVITKVVREGADIEIPANGYVLYQRARRGENEGNFFNSCAVGDMVELKTTYTDRRSGEVYTSLSQAIAAGPRITLGGSAYGGTSTYNEEGFYASDITGGGSARRVAVGIKSNGNILLLTAYCSVQRMGEIMASMGCSDAMNLDGGASSGIYANGMWLISPGRYLNNMIYFK